MATPQRDLCPACRRAPRCSGRSTPAKPVLSCKSFEAHEDLCITCNHEATCDRRGTSLRPVYYCEEFDAYVPVPQAAPPVTRKVERREYRGIGLCLDCEERSVCTVPKPEGGIWNCERYR